MLRMPQFSPAPSWPSCAPPPAAPARPTPDKAEAHVHKAKRIKPNVFVAEKARLELSEPVDGGGEASFRVARLTKGGATSYVGVKIPHNGVPPLAELKAMVAAQSHLRGELYQAETGEAFLTMRLGDNHLHAAIWGVHAARVGEAAVEAWAIEVLRQTTTRLAALHAAGFAHRDLKPQNIFVRPSGEVFLGDYGNASDAGWRAEPKGTPGYMSPDMLRGATAVQRDDMWMLGIVGLTLIMDATPFDPDREFAHLPLEEYQRRCNDIQRQEMDGYLSWRTGRETFLSDDRSRLGRLKAYNATYFEELGRRAPRLAPLLRDLLDPNGAARPAAPPLLERLGDLQRQQPAVDLTDVWRHVPRAPGIDAQLRTFEKLPPAP
jgi:hypothetical protein